MVDFSSARYLLTTRPRFLGVPCWTPSNFRLSNQTQPVQFLVFNASPVGAIPQRPQQASQMSSPLVPTTSTCLTMVTMGSVKKVNTSWQSFVFFFHVFARELR